MATVHLSVFSGRENPTFVINSQEANSIISEIEALPNCKDTNYQHAGLGYSGFLIVRGQEYYSIEPSGHIEVRKTNRRGEPNEVCKFDPGRSVERRLIGMARLKLAPEFHPLMPIL